MSYRASINGYKQATVLLLLLVTVSGLMLMASINLLNLFLSHYQQRRQEFATQYCLGASKGRLLLMSALELLPMFILAGIVGLLGAAWLIRLLPEIDVNTLELVGLIHLDGLTVFIAGLLIGLINLLFAWMSHVNSIRKT